MDLHAPHTANTALAIMPFSPEHLPEVLHLFRLNTPGYFHPGEKKDILSYLQMHSHTYFIAYSGSTAVGACGYHITPANDARISWTFIHPSFKGRGIGKALVCHCLALIRNHPVNKVTVWTSNLSWQFYGKLGFILISIKKNHWAPGLDLYYMEEENTTLLSPLSHKERQVQFIELLLFDDWKIKIYGISQHDRQPSASLIEKAKHLALSVFPQPAVCPHRYGLGFLIVHEADAFNQVTFDWWEQVNELRHIVFRTLTEDKTSFADITHTGQAFCVWEIKVLSFERDAWVSVLRSGMPPGQNYLTARLSIQT